MSGSTTRVLFVTWDGPDQAYLESLFLPIFERLRVHGFAVDVLQYSYATDEARERSANACRAAGVGYFGRHAARRLGPLGVAATIALGAREIAARADDYSLIMPRSILPAAMALGSEAARSKLMFDADGLAADERLETAGSGGGRPFYAAYREIERRALTHARGVITRTNAAADILVARAGPALSRSRVFVIPNGSDEDRFAPADEARRQAVRAELGIPAEAPWYVSVGSIGPQYLPETQLALFRAIQVRRSDAYFSVFTGRPSLLGPEWREVLGHKLDVRRLAPHEVARVLGAADVGIALRRPSFSQRAVSPIKISEYLLSGLPVVATKGVGDLNAVLGRETEATLLMDPEALDLDRAAEWAVDAGTTRRLAAGRAARRVGLDRCSLSACAIAYAAALQLAAADAPSGYQLSHRALPLR